MINLSYNDIIIQYAKFTQKMFDYLKTKIGQYATSARLNIMLYDTNERYFGSCNYPIDIDIFIGDILKDFEDKVYEESYTRYIKSIITQTLLHELLHTTMLPDIRRYNSDKEYRDKIEKAIDAQSVMILLNYAKEIYELFGFNIEFKLFTHTIEGPYNNNGYNETALKDYYTITIRNAFDLNLDEINKLFNDYDSIRITVRGDSFGEKWVMIKAKGKYNEDTGSFARLISDYVTVNDTFTFKRDHVIMDSSIYGKLLDMSFLIYNGSCYPMEFKP